MQVKVVNLYSQVSKNYSGVPSVVAQQIMLDYPWVRTGIKSEDELDDVIKRINRAQALIAGVIQEDGLSKSETEREADNDSIVHSFLGHKGKLQAALKAASFLSSRQPHLQTMRRALWQHDGDVLPTALLAHNLEVTPANLKALQAVLKLSDYKKTEGEVDLKTCEPLTPEAQEMAQRVQKAIDDRFVVPVNLTGKHTAGTLLVRDDEAGETILIKPGGDHEDAGPQAGVTEEKANQSRREAAFYQEMALFNLGNFSTESQLLLLDGQEVAGIKLLPWNYQTLDTLQDQGQDPRRILGPYLAEGALHKLCALSYILGSPDEHLNNYMIGPHNELKLIDHGSAFAGKDFSPGTDNQTFVPGALRVWVPSGVNFNSLTPDEKIGYMPRVSERVAKDIAEWLSQVNIKQVESIMIRYGINPEPSMSRLHRLLTMITTMPADLAINTAWVS